MKKWECDVCGFVHEGEKPPEKCPVCDSPGTLFALMIEAKKEEAKAIAGKRWRCIVCGYVHEGDEPPEICPVCAAPKSMFVEIDAEGKEIGAPLQPGRVAAVGRMGPAARTPCARGWHRHRHRDHAVAPYVISVVPDPVQVAREMRRVCRDRRVRRSMRASLRRDPPHSDSTWGGCHGERLTSSRGPA